MSDEIIALAKQHYEAVRDLLLPVELTPEWQKHRIVAAEAIPFFSTAQEAIYWAQTPSNAWFDHRVNANRELLADKKKQFQACFPGIWLRGESSWSRPETVWNDGELFLSNMTFWHHQALVVATIKVPRPKRILEIGVGYGGLAYLFQLAQPDCRYVLCDTPETLFFAEVFLRSNFPRTSCAWGWADSAHFVFLPLSLRGLAAADYDLIIAQGSFQEMTPEALAWWMGFCQRNARHLYSLNYAITPIPLEGWEIVHDEVDPPLVLGDTGSGWRELVLRREP
mgnify:FL=1